jgi:WD40 repeat protein
VGAHGRKASVVFAARPGDRGGGEYGYDAFISYSHRGDHDLAVGLQIGLERFAKRWNQRRALRVFRDEASLTANPALWESIEQALSASKWFVILASATAAQSGWVNREIEWWLANRSPRRLLIVATSPGLVWDTRLGDWAADAPVPPALRGALTQEPRVADLSGVALRDRRLKLPDDAVADVAAPIHGKPKDDLVGDHVREYRRTRRLARAAVLGLSILTAATVTASIIATGQRNDARNQAEVATAGELAALSGVNLTTHFDLAQLLAVTAYTMDNDDQTQAALYQAVTASPHLVRYLQAGDPVETLGTSANGNVVVAGTITGRLVWFDLATGVQQSEPTGLGAISGVAVNADGSAVVATDGRGTTAWDARAKSGPHRIAGDGTVSGLAVSPSGRYAAVVYSSSSSQNSVTVVDVSTGSQVHATVPSPLDKVMFSSGSSLVTFNGGGGWEQFALPALREISHGGRFLAPASSAYTLGTSPAGRYSAYITYGSVTSWNTTDTAHVFSANNVTPSTSAASLAISPDGKWTAVVVAGTIYVGRLGDSLSSADNVPTRTELAANGNTTDVSFLGGDDRLVSVSGDSVVLWNLRQTSRLGQPMGVSVPIAAMYGFPPTLEFSPNGNSLVLLGGNGGVSVYHPGKRYTKIDSSGTQGDGNLLVWAGDQPELLQSDAYNMSVVNTRGQPLQVLRDPGENSYVITARSVQGGSKVVTVDQSGTISVLSMRTGLIRRIAGHADGLQAQMIAISPDGNMVAESDHAQGRVVLLDVPTGASKVVGTGQADGVLFAGSRLLIQRSAGSLEIWDATGRQLLRTLPGGGGYADALAVSPDGSLLARLGEDGNASITSLSTGDVLTSFTLPVPVDNGDTTDPWLATAMQFTPDGHSLLTATTGGELIRWNIYPEDLVKIACSIAGRALTDPEWRQYVRTPPPKNLACGH